MPLTEEEKKRRREERTRKRLEERKKEELPPLKPVKGEGAGRPIGAIERGGAQFALPARELRELERRGKLAPKETLAGQAAARRQAGIDVAAEGRLGAGAFKEELREKILEPPSLEPTPLIEEAADLGFIPEVREGEQVPGLREALLPLGIERIAREKEDFLRKELNRFIAGTALAGTALLGAVALPAAISAVTKIATTSAVGGASNLIKTAAAGILVYTGVGKIADINRGKLDSMRGSLTKIPGLSSTTLSSVQTGGLSPEDGMEELRQLADSVDFAESRIKELGVFNMKYRTSEEYIEVMKEIEDARSNILERVGGIEQVARTGRPQLDPEALIINLEQQEEFKES